MLYEQRMDHHLTHDEDNFMIKNTFEKYKLISDENKQIALNSIVSTPSCCGGRPRLNNHRLTMEQLVTNYIYKFDLYEIDDYTKDELENICIVWFFENWMKDNYYNLIDCAK